MKNPVIVELKNVFFSYGAFPVIENASISVREKDYLGFVGPNGGGKTTLLRLILGVLLPTKGNIEVFGKSPREGRKFLGYVPQVTGFEFDFPINVGGVVLMGRLGKRRWGRNYNKEDVRVCLESLRKVGMDRFKDRQIGELSSGQVQRVLIARALANEPRLLLLDEPFSSIDTDWQSKFYGLLAELNKRMAIVLVSHDLDALADHTESIICVNRRVLYCGSTQEGIKKISGMYRCYDHALAKGRSKND